VTVPPRDLVIVGLGSPFGDDQIGWAAIDRLLQAGVAAAVRARDGIDLLLALEGHDEAIVIDASAPSGCPGRIGRYDWPNADLSDDMLWSTHGLGLTAALKMAAALGRLPRRIAIYAVEADANAPADALSDAALRALERLIDAILRDEFVRSGNPT
jgi:hydrogenase maturation protease